MRMQEKIQAEINRIKNETRRVDEHGNVYRSITQAAHTAIDNAEQWLANGGLSRYSNQDFDILNSLSSY